MNVNLPARFGERVRNHRPLDVIVVMSEIQIRRKDGADELVLQTELGGPEEVPKNVVCLVVAIPVLNESSTVVSTEVHIDHQLLVESGNMVEIQVPHGSQLGSGNVHDIVTDERTALKRQVEIASGNEGAEIKSRAFRRQRCRESTQLVESGNHVHGLSGNNVGRRLAAPEINISTTHGLE